MYDLENKQHFSLRKLSVGLASVLIGISFFSTSQAVKADTVADQQASTMTNNVRSSDTQKNGNTVESSSSNDNQVNNAKNNVKQVQNRTETKPKQAQTENIQQDSVPKTQEANDSKDLGAEKGIVKTSSLQEHDNQSNQVAETSTQHGTLESGQKTQSFNLSQNSQKSTKKVLTTNLIATPPTTNGGFDEATWGKLDVNNWQGSVQNGVYELTSYTGDPLHIIVPNAADFEQAGKSTNGLQVGITCDTVHSLLLNKVQTIAFSKTNNQKVKAIGTDWSRAFSYYRSSLSKFDGSNLDVSGVTDMDGMFFGNKISNLTGLAKWDTSKVTDMSYMFGSTSIRDLTPLANWNTSNVTNMIGMFARNPDLIDLKPIANWNISNVKVSFNLFAGDSKLNLMNINNTSLMQGFLKTPHALQGSSFITNNADLVKAVVDKDLPIFTNTATRTITFYIPHADPKQTIQHIYYKTIAPVQIDWPIRSIGGGGFSSGAGSSVVVGGHGSSSGGRSSGGNSSS
ncbi:BspA family leucine-rich repeat surface protein, partial [Lactobacillus crispatus]